MSGFVHMPLIAVGRTLPSARNGPGPDLAIVPATLGRGVNPVTGDTVAAEP
jgi:hypothetical protein